MHGAAVDELLELEHSYQ